MGVEGAEPSIAAEPLTVFGAIAALLFLGFVGQQIFAKLRINDTLLLIGVGVALGPVLRIIEPESVEPVRALVGPLALILILFDGGLALKFRDLLHGLGSAASLALIGFVTTAAAIGVVASWALGIPFTTGLILGAILGGTSALVVMPSLEHIKTEPKTKATLNLESALTDVLVVVVAFTLINIVALGQGLDAQDIASKLVIVFAMSIFIGMASAFLWLWLVPALRDTKYGYMLTLAVMFGLYVVVEWLLQDVSAGGGPLAVLAFGVILGNAESLGGTLRERVGVQFTEGLQRFQGEISFLVRTFFFIYLGLLVEPALLVDPFTLALGLLILAAMFAARYLAVGVTRRQLRLAGDSRVLWVMMPRGLAAAVLAAVPASVPYSIPGTDRFVALAFLALVLTNLTTTFGATLLEAIPASSGERKLKRAAKAEAKRASKPSRKERKAATKAAKRAVSTRTTTTTTARAKSSNDDEPELEFQEKNVGAKVDKVISDLRRADTRKPRKQPRRKDKGR